VVRLTFVTSSRRVSLFVALDEDEAQAVARAARQVGADPSLARVVRRSLDARKGRPIGFHLELELGAPEEEPEETPARARAGLRVVVVGSGPAGTFAAARLAEAGARVTLVEMGKPVQPRRHDLAALTQRGALDPSSNYCFGEGGAGTFSDGKLYTRVKDRRGVRTVLRTLVSHGADPGILVDSRPHIGSNRLPKILVAFRQHLESLGVEYAWNERVSDLLIGDAVAGGTRVRGVRCASGREIEADAVVLAVGHSARALYEALAERKVALQAKPFAVGARVEHAQSMVDRAQYGSAFQHPKLPAAFYEIKAQIDARGVYSFCMCPGGWVVDSSTEAGRLCTNGMSLSRRDSPFANAALVVSVEPRDYQGAGAWRFGDGVLAGILLQRSIEERAFADGFAAPSQRAADFVARRPSVVEAKSSYRPRVRPGDVRAALPPYVGDALERALARFQKMMPGFLDGNFVGVETRTSSPVRILRDASLQSPSHPGLFPSGEGAGYAGGIVSAAIDGLHVADAVLSM
jgi:uncharacterized FAD-dependent dehydrogenase